MKEDPTKLLESLQDSILKTQCFKTKWSLINTKLITLQTHLVDLSSTTAAASAAVTVTAAAGTNNSNNNNPLSVDLLRSLSATLSSALSLSTLCHSSTPPHGKLKTQNDIDSISAQLDALINDTHVINKSGSNSNRNSRESTQKAELRSLITRLQIGTTESKNSVLDSLLSLLNEDDKNVTIAVGQELVPVLIRLLDSNSSLEIKEKAVSCITRVSSVTSLQQILITEGLGLLNNLLRLLECGSVFAKEKSCLALQAMSQSKENARAIGCRGGISSLLEICQTGTPNSQALAAGVLRNLAVFEEIKENFIEENAVVTLLILANSGTQLAQENALECLCNLMRYGSDKKDNDNIKLVFVRNGGIDCLKNFWDSTINADSLQVAVSMLCVLASYPLIQDLIVENDFLNRVVVVLSCEVLGLRVSAAKAVYDLAYNNKTRKELGEMGCISPLVRMLEGKAVEEKEAASKALSMLLVYAGNRRVFRKEERGIIGVVQLLDPTVKDLDKKYPVSILVSLAHSKKYRKQMVAAGASLHLHKLAEMEVDNAKKLLDSLGRGKLWGVFGRH